MAHTGHVVQVHVRTVYTGHHGAPIQDARTDQCMHTHNAFCLAHALHVAVWCSSRPLCAQAFESFVVVFRCSSGFWCSGVPILAMAPKATVAKKASIKKTIRQVSHSRGSTPTNKDRGGKARAQRATFAAAAVRNDDISEYVHEIVSGTAPLAKRKRMLPLIEKIDKYTELNTVHCESARDVARDLFVGEAIHQKAKENGINIAPADNPTLFSHKDTHTNRQDEQAHALNFARVL